MNHESSKIVLEHILETLRADFERSPTDDHVYFHAFSAMFGEPRARKELLSVLQANEEAET